MRDFAATLVARSHVFPIHFDRSMLMSRISHRQVRCLSHVSLVSSAARWRARRGASFFYRPGPVILSRDFNELFVE